MDTIRVRGAREHNLQNVSVDLPRYSLTVITGLSGSGKSSLAFDTIYAEGQRRYVESLSSYARQFLELMQKPDVDAIEGLSPAISIEQKTTSRNPRSTVGTVTEIYDYMRLMFARVGTPYSPATGLPIEAQTVSQMVDRVMAMDEGTRLLLLAPIVRGRKGEYKKELQDQARRGFQRVRIDGEMFDLEDAPDLDKKYKHDIEIVVDRLVVKKGIELTALKRHWAWLMAFPLSMTSMPSLKQLPRVKKAALRIMSPKVVLCSLQSSPAPYPVSPLTRLSRGCFRLTTRLVPARHVMVWGQKCSLMLSWLYPMTVKL